MASCICNAGPLRGSLLVWVRELLRRMLAQLSSPFLSVSRILAASLVHVPALGIIESPLVDGAKWQ